MIKLNILRLNVKVRLDKKNSWETDKKNCQENYDNDVKKE